MVDCHGSQCGFCTPGFIMSLYGLWLSNEKPDRAEIEKALQGNLCRCTGYEPIVKAAEQVSLQRPSTLFDPLEKTRAEIIARLWAMQASDTISIVSEEGRLIVPRSVEALAGVLASEPMATVVAGSTDVGLWVTKQMRQLNPVVFINHLTELQTITAGEYGIAIGAGVTYTRALDTIARKIPAFARLITRIGGDQVRNMGTIGGNIANGSPIGDSPPPLIALGAQLTLRSAEGARTIPLEDYFIAYGKQDRQPGEFVESVFVPYPVADAKFAVYKISKRRDEDITAVLGAFYLVLDETDRVTDIRIALGGMAATPKRARSVEAELIGEPWTEATIEAARPAFDTDFQPLTDWRATAEYRQLTAKNLLTRFYLETVGAPAELKRFEEVA
jgi:xanthine dehydrogenase small subunit